MLSCKEFTVKYNNTGDKAVQDYFDVWREKLWEQENPEHYTRDLILRPTENPVGLYEDKDGFTFIVCSHENKNYILIWSDVEDTEDICEPGDLTFKGCYPSGIDNNGFGVTISVS